MQQPVPPSVSPDSDKATPTPIEVLQSFRVVVRTTQRHAQWIERQSGVAGSQLWALQELRERPGLRVGELGNLMALHQSTASNMVDRLETSGYVRKERGTTDQRVVRLYLTEKGVELLSQAPLPARGVLVEALRSLPSEDLIRLNQGLDLLLGRIKQMEAEGFGMNPLSFSK